VSESVRMWIEIAFNLAYLAVIYVLVAAMARRQRHVPADGRVVSRLFIAAFALLALGDTGHVGFRVLAYALGGLDATLNLRGTPVGLVGLGALATAFTITLFYVLILFIWRARFRRALGWFGVLLLASAAVRLALMIPAANEWNSAEPPLPWSIYRNLPLMVQGLGVAYLILRDALRTRDRTFVWVGAMILVSYAFYMPVIFWVQRFPLLGMLMIPKTMAYVAIAFLAYDSARPVPAVQKPHAARRLDARSPAD
jgi:hypothetical protein